MLIATGTVCTSKYFIQGKGKLRILRVLKWNCYLGFCMQEDFSLPSESRCRLRPKPLSVQCFSTSVVVLWFLFVGCCLSKKRKEKSEFKTYISIGNFQGFLAFINSEILIKFDIFISFPKRSKGHFFLTNTAVETRFTRCFSGLCVFTF